MHAIGYDYTANAKRDAARMAEEARVAEEARARLAEEARLARANPQPNQNASFAPLAIDQAMLQEVVQAAFNKCMLQHLGKRSLDEAALTPIAEETGPGEADKETPPAAKKRRTEEF